MTKNEGRQWDFLWTWMESFMEVTDTLPTKATRDITGALVRYLFADIGVNVYDAATVHTAIVTASVIIDLSNRALLDGTVTDADNTAVGRAIGAFLAGLVDYMPDEARVATQYRS